jgi:glycosyltransferase involved in cell wall biosynthesis
MNFSKLKVAIVCDWLTTPGGAEKIILSMHKLFPTATIYTSIYDEKRNPDFSNAVVRTSYLQSLPLSKTKHQLYFPLMPGVFENFNLNQYDLVISSSHSCAKGIITKPSTLHISYCHSPMRYAWENSINYINEYQINPVIKKIAPWIIHKIRIWDRLSADRVDYFIANSKHIQRRINKYYRRPSTVIQPFVDINKYSVSEEKEDYYLAVGRLTPYKKFDLVVDAFNKLNKRIKIVGTGVSADQLKKSAAKNIEFLGYVNDEELQRLYSKAKALIFPQIEDFGIIPLEAMSAGCPVIAYGKGGVLETVVNKKTGLFFNDQTTESLVSAILQYEKMKFSPQTIRKHAENFSENVFQEKILDFIAKKWQIWQKEMI